MTADHSFAYRPVWATGVSVLAHLGALVALIILAVPRSPPPVMPQIELLPALPVVTTPQEAKPTPLNLPVSTKPTPPAAFAPPVPTPAPPRVIASTHAEMPLPLPPPRQPRHQRKPWRRPQPIPSKAIARSLTAPSSVPINGNATKDKTVIAKAQANPTPAGPPPSYLGLIQARLLQVKQYPTQARFDHREGTVTVRFTIDRAGRVLSDHLRRGSGVSSLDAEAMDMIARASPFPPMPPSLAEATLELIVPIEFSLKNQ